MKNEFKILLVEDNEGDARLIRELLKDAAPLVFHVTRAGSLNETIKILSETSFDSILLDLGLPDSVGIETFISLNERFPEHATTIILTGLNDVEIGLVAVNSGAQDYLIKGQVDSEKLAKSIVYSFERNRLNHELKLELEARRMAEEELRERELQYLNLANSGIAMIWTSGTDKMTNYFNSTWLNFTGQTLEHELGNGWAEAIHPDDHDRILKIYSACFDMREPFEIEYRLLVRSNEYRWILDMGVPNYNRFGEFIGYIGNCFDITERKQSQLALETQHAMLTALINSSNDVIIFSLNRYHCYTEFNEKHRQEMKLVWNVDIRQGMNLLDCMTVPELRELARKSIDQALEGEVVKEIQYQPNLDLYFDFSWNPIWQNNEVIGVAAFINDISEQKRTEFALQKSENEFRLLAESVPQFVWITQPNGKNIYFNQQWVDYTGLSLEESYGDGWNIPFHPDDQQRAWIAWQNATQNNADYSLECRLRRFDGVYKWWLIRGEPVLDSNGTILKWFGTCTDIDELKISEAALIVAKEHAEESDRLKSAFLANMSHEIRTPMNGILGFTELLKQPDLSGEKQKDYICIVQKSGDRMLNIINDIVDISKIESGQMKIAIAPTNINEKIEFLFTFFKPEAENKGIELSFKNGLPANESNIKTDSEKIYAILTNLIKNAIKYSSEGSIEFGYVSTSSTTESVSEPVELLQFYVKDHGIGIPKHRQQAIFERFIQVEIVDKLARQGAGLGLSIAKAYVEMLGGKIWVESEPGQGSTFYFTIPYLPFTATDSSDGDEILADSKDLPKNKSLKILIVEDDETSEMLLTEIVRSYSKEIYKARTGTEAVEACRKHPDLDMILMDIQLPEMSGYEATRQIRQHNKKVAIIAQTAYALYGDREKAIEAGCNDYVTKPIRKVQLSDLIQKYFNR